MVEVVGGPDHQSDQQAPCEHLAHMGVAVGTTSVTNSY